MKKLYIIRRSLEHYIGPMNVDGLKKSFKRMEFGLQDEIGSSLGPWIQLEDQSRLKRNYPEIAKLVTKDLMSDWGVSNHSQVPLAIKKTKRSGSTTSLKGILIGVGLSLLIFGAAQFYFENYVPSQKDPSVMVQRLVNLIRDDPQSAQQQLKQNKDFIAQHSLRSKESYQAWLPILRYLAFDMYEPKLADGVLKLVGGIDCRVENLAATFRSMDDYRAVSTIKNRMLLWDPHWIRRRVEYSQSGRNDFEGCLRVARHILVRDPEFAQNKEFDIPRARVQYQLEVLSRGSAINRSEHRVFAAIQCLESSGSRCMEVRDLKDADPMNWLNQYESRQMVGALIARKDTLAEADVQILRKSLESLSAVDPLTRLDYTFENEFASYLIEHKGDTKKVREIYAQIQLTFAP